MDNHFQSVVHGLTPGSGSSALPRLGEVYLKRCSDNTAYPYVHVH